MSDDKPKEQPLEIPQVPQDDRDRINEGQEFEALEPPVETEPLS